MYAVVKSTLMNWNKGFIIIIIIITAIITKPSQQLM